MILEVFCEKGVLRNFAKFTGIHLCQSIFLNKVAGLRPKACNYIKKETLAQVFACEFCEIFNNFFFKKTPLSAASGITWMIMDYFSMNQKLFTFIVFSNWLLDRNCTPDPAIHANMGTFFI